MTAACSECRHGRTSRQLKIGDGLPLVHGHEPPSLSLPATAQVDDKLLLVAAEVSEDVVKPALAELALRE